MKTSWRHKLLCCVLIAALAAQCASLAFAVDPTPQIYYLQGGTVDENGVWTPDYWVDEQGNHVEETTASVRKRAAATLPSSYDLRDFDLVTPVKHQAGSGSCWAFSAIASLESSCIRQGFGTAQDTDFSEAHLAWFAHRQRTTDTSDPTYGDGMIYAQPFTVGGSWQQASSSLMRGVGPRLEEDAPWITTYDTNTLMQMEQPESDRYAYCARTWSVTTNRDDSATALKQMIMHNGAATLSYYDNYVDFQRGRITYSGYNDDRTCYYQTAKVKQTNHIVTVVGWDDDYPRTKFSTNNAQPSADGAWLIKGSWSTAWGKRGYYWISYEDPSVCAFASYVAAPADTYDHIYQYDGTLPSIKFSVSNSAKMANVFTAERDELLTHVSFFSSNATPVKATAEVYTAPEDFVYSGMHPTSGMEKISAATTIVNGIEYGYSTMELNTPVLLSQGQTFSVVVTFELNGAKVEIPVEGTTVANPADGVSTYSGSIGQSFAYFNGAWSDTKACKIGTKTYDYNNVPLKAMTCDLSSQTQSLTLIKEPDTTTYSIGESFDGTGMALLYTDADGNTTVVSGGYTCDTPVFNEPGEQTVTISYNGLSVSVGCKVILNDTPTLTLAAAPDVTSYMVGDEINTTGLELLYTDEYGVENTVTDGYFYTPHTLCTIGQKTVTVVYNDLSVTFDVTSRPYETALTLRSAPNKTTYMVGDALDTTGLSLSYSDEYGKVNTVTKGFTCDVQTLSVIGTQTVTAAYKDLSVTFDVTVEPYEPTLTLQSAPDKTEYEAGETLDTTGLCLLYTDEFGDAYDVEAGFECDVQTLTTVGTQTVTVTYNDLSVTFDVTVLPGLFIVTDASGRAGETVDVAVRIARNPGIVSAWLELSYDPDVLELIDVQNGEIFADGDFTPGNDLAAVPFRVLLMDAVSEENYTQNGDLVVFTFRVRTDAPDGDTAISVQYNEDSTCDVDLQNVPFETQDGTFTVRRLPGDVNADGDINLKDVVLLRRYLADWGVTVNLSNADIDQIDGVTLRDAATICRYLAEGYDVVLL